VLLVERLLPEWLTISAARARTATAAATIVATMMMTALHMEMVEETRALRRDLEVQLREAASEVFSEEEASVLMMLDMEGIIITIIMGAAPEVIADIAIAVGIWMEMMADMMTTGGETMVRTEGVKEGTIMETMRMRGGISRLYEEQIKFINMLGMGFWVTLAAESSS